jgi:hypothetical protein
MKITLNELRKLVKSVIKEEFTISNLEYMPEMESKLINMLEEYQDALKKTSVSDDVELKSFIQDKLLVLRKMMNLIMDSEKFTKERYEYFLENFSIKETLTDLFKGDISEEDALDSLSSLIGSQYKNDIQDFLNDFDTFSSVEEAFNKLQNYI